MTQPSYEAAPPAYQQGPPPGGPSGPRAGFWNRFLALLLDGLILLVPGIILAVTVKAPLSSLLDLLIGLGYFVYFEGGPTGQTLGKKAVGIRVYDFRQGGPIGYGRALLRYVVKSFLSWFFLLGYLWMLWDREKQTWHDKAAGSVVVPADAYR